MQYLPLRSYDNYIDAHLRLQQLEAEGIRAVLQDEYTVTIDPFLSNAVGGIKLMVPDVQWERARSIVETLEAVYKKSLTCPRCGSDSDQRVPVTNKAIQWFTLLIFGKRRVHVDNKRGKNRCTVCGHEKPVPDEPMDE